MTTTITVVVKNVNVIVGSTSDGGGALLSITQVIMFTGFYVKVYDLATGKVTFAVVVAEDGCKGNGALADWRGKVVPEAGVPAFFLGVVVVVMVGFVVEPSTDHVS
jgi:hypothetical protein